MQHEKPSSSAPETEDRRGRLLGYASVSPRHTDPTPQISALAAAGCDDLHVEHLNHRTGRPELDTLLAGAHPCDTLVIWRLDRLASSLKELVTRINTLADGGIHLRSIAEGLDTTTACGQALLTVSAALAEADKHYRSEQTQPGLAAARAAGRLGGRPPAMTPRMKRAAWQLRDRGQSAANIARTLGVSRATIHRTLTNQAGPDKPHHR